ncbi:MAG: hypothetical protein ACLR7M_07085, partial [Varibaculum timonense]
TNPNPGSKPGKNTNPATKPGGQDTTMPPSGSSASNTGRKTSSSIANTGANTLWSWGIVLAVGLVTGGLSILKYQSHKRKTS